MANQELEPKLSDFRACVQNTRLLTYVWRLGWLGWGGGVSGGEKNDWEYSQSNIYNTILFLETYTQTMEYYTAI